jgi:hypothetical protein
MGRSSNLPPVVATTLPERPALTTNEFVRFRMTVSDPDGDRVTARIVRAPGRMRFAAIVDEPSGASREVAWYPEEADGGLRELEVEARDEHGAAARYRFPMQIVNPTRSSSFEVVNLDEDDELEMLARSTGGTIAGVRSGAIAVFDDLTSDPAGERSPTLLTADAPHLWGGLGGGGAQYLQVADVTGDGINDVIAADQDRGGTLYVWHGPIPRRSSPKPDAVLHGNDPSGGGGGFKQQQQFLEDVTADGILDVVIAFPDATTMVASEGEICVFAGGPGLAGVPAPTATLRRPSPTTDDHLGVIGPRQQATWFGDVTGDGVTDVVVAVPTADLGTAKDVGELLVWSGGASLAGTPAPTAVLQVLPSGSNERLGSLGTFGAGDGVALVDVTGDGIRDVLAVSPGGSTRPTAIYVWPGGQALVGTLSYGARLLVKTGSHARSLAVRQGLLFEDLDLDGVLDVLACSTSADVAGQSAAGAIYLWHGGAMSGDVDATATLQLASPARGDGLGAAPFGVQLCDVSGDGHPDVLVPCHHVTGVVNPAGLVHVWLARSGLAGAVREDTTLVAPIFGFDPGWLAMADVTGDGIDDVVYTHSWLPRGGVDFAGAILVWEGGASIAAGGAIQPRAVLQDPRAQDFDRLGNERPAWLLDFDGDGVTDVIAPSGTRRTRTRAAVQIWRGGSTLIGALAPTAAAESLQLDEQFGSDGAGLFFGDVTGGPGLDLVVLAPGHDRGPEPEVGAAYVFPGGALTSASIAPAAILTSPRAKRYDHLGDMHVLGANAVRIVDLDGDAKDDLFIADPDAMLPTAGSYAGLVLEALGPLRWSSPTWTRSAPMLGRLASLSH